MKIRAFLISLLCILYQNSFSQVNYFENLLIIKFNDTSSEVNLKSKMQSNLVFKDYNIDIHSSVWTELKSERFARKRKSTSNIDYEKLFEPLTNTFYASFESDIDALELARVLTNLPEIEYAEPRYIYETSYNIIDDPIVNSFVNTHQFPEAWEIEQGSSDIIIGIIDSGVNYNHEDLKNKQWLNVDEIPDNGIDDDENGFIDDYLGWDFWESGYTYNDMTSDNDPFAEHNSHGTHVAGIAAAEHNNVGLAGAGYKSLYMAIKSGGVKDDPNTPDTDESRSIGFGYEGILYAFTNGAQIINCSWGGDEISEFGRDILKTVTDGGSLVISSAGNSNTSSPEYPPANENVLSVGAIEPSGVKASYSNYGETVDVFAVGTIQSSVGVGQNGYAVFSGTSMSSPVVAGLAALLKAQNPTWSPQRIMFQIANTAESIDDNNSGFEPNSFGKGSINAFKALEKAVPILRVDSLVALNEGGDALDFNEQGTLKAYIKNYGGFAESVLINPRVSNLVVHPS